MQVGGCWWIGDGIVVVDYDGVGWFVEEYWVVMVIGCWYRGIYFVGVVGEIVVDVVDVVYGEIVIIGYWYMWLGYGRDYIGDIGYVGIQEGCVCSLECMVFVVSGCGRFGLV